MPKDKRGEAVEGYKLSDEQRRFQISYTKLREISEMLEAETFRKTQELQDLRQMWQGLNEQFKALPIPQSPTRELEGMDFGAEESGVTSPESGTTPQGVSPQADLSGASEDFNISY